MDDEGDLEAEIERELEHAEQERQAAVAAKRRPKLLEVRHAISVRRNEKQIHHTCKLVFYAHVLFR